MKITKTKGFSLVEMMIVIAIIGIVATIAFFAWQRYTNNANLQVLAREVSMDMTKNKQMSITQGLHYRMTITTGTPGNYTIERWNAANTALIQVMKIKSPADFGPGLSIDSTTYVSNTIVFQPRGTSSSGSVVLKNSINSTATITSNITGKNYVKFNMH
jgi:prepilin-type N-terminal cleavage/methylation domain-containing protein